MKSFILAVLMLVALTGAVAQTQINNDPSSDTQYKREYHLRDVLDEGDGWFYMPAPGLMSLMGVTDFLIGGGSLTISNNPGVIYFEQADGLQSLSTERDMSGYRPVVLPFDSGYVPILNVTRYGTAAFEDVDTEVTITIDGAQATDIYTISPRFTGDPIAEVLSWEATDGALIVHRPSGGNAGLEFSWQRLSAR